METADVVLLPSWKEKRERQKELNKASNRLKSIHYDVVHFLHPTVLALRNQSITWPILGNERAGPWYAQPVQQDTCYFKSTDGHVCNFSLKRLNLHVLEYLHIHGGCIIVDTSRTKSLPDSLSRTIPVWASCMNRYVHRLRNKNDNLLTWWDDDLHTPTSAITEEERLEMLMLIDSLVDALESSGAILQPNELVKQVQRPVRAVWITHDSPASIPLLLENLNTLSRDYLLLVCISTSTTITQQRPFEFYSPGAADDEESWTPKGYSPFRFWGQQHRHNLCIDGLPHSPKHAFEPQFDWIGSTMIAIGSRRAGRPPECQNHFDAILNVSTQEYKDNEDGSLRTASEGGSGGIDENMQTYYLQLPVQEGKRSELEKWLAVGIYFCVYHAAYMRRRVLVHCAQGKDRSVAIVMATLALFGVFKEEGDETTKVSLSTDMVGHLVMCMDRQYVAGEADMFLSLHGNSGLSTSCVEMLMGRSGRDWMLRLFQTTQLQINKESIRNTLHVVQRYRKVASPSRATMQKLNRFFLSGEHEKAK